MPMSTYLAVKMPLGNIVLWPYNRWATFIHCWYL